MNKTKNHIVLCGDSIIDNGSNVNQEELDVAGQFQEELPDSIVT